MVDQVATALPSIEPIDDASSIHEAELQRLGITVHRHSSYEWNGYRYSVVTDAIAAAKRGAE